MPNAARRPLRTRDARWARTLATWLVNRRIRPNWISLASLGFAAAGALAMLAAPAASPGGRAALFVLAAACIQFRLLCNMLDGMVAVEGGLGSSAGDIYNELPDRIADPLLIVPAGYATGFALGPELGWIAGMLAVFTAYIRALGGTCGLPQSFVGPMAKPHRMATMTGGLLLAALVVPLGREGAVIFIALTLVAVGALITAGRRTSAILKALAP